MTTVSLGKVGFTWKGDYSASTTYNEQDVVAYNGDSFICVTDNTTNVAPTSTSTTTSPQTVNLTVTVQSYYGSNYFYIDGVRIPTLQLYEGNTYIFDVSDSSMSNHPLRFSETSNGTHNSGTEYTTGVTSSGTAGSAGATVTIVVASSAPLLYYYCGNHSGMGGTANTPSYATNTTTTSNWNLFAQGSLGVGQNSGDLIYFDGSQLQRLPVGNANQVLKIDATTQLPVWGETNYRSGLKVKALTDGRYTTNYRRGYVAMEDGTMRGWGSTNSTYGLHGDGSQTDRVLPVQTALDYSNGFTGIKTETDGSISTNSFIANYYQTVVIGNNNHLYNWGYNGYGQLGDGTTNNRTLPYDASANSSNSLYGKLAYKICPIPYTASYTTHLVLCTDGTAHACGYNAYGQLGNSSTTQANNYTAVSQTAVKFWNVFLSDDQYTSCIALGAVYGDALVGGGTVSSSTDIFTETPVKFRVYFWGYSGDYQNGFNTSTNYSVPTEISFFYSNNHNIVECYPTRHSWFAKTDGGDLYFWGYPYAGHGGTGTTSTTVSPTQVLTGVKDVTTCNSADGNTCVMVLKTNGEVWSSGYNGYGQLGIGSTSNVSTFTQSQTAPSNITKIVVAGYNSYDTFACLTSDGEVYAVGYGGNNQIGNGTGNNYDTWQKMLLQKVAVDITGAGYSSEGSFHILCNDGTLYGVGYGGTYQNAEYNGNNYSTPQPIIF